MENYIESLVEAQRVQVNKMEDLILDLRKDMKNIYQWEIKIQGL